MTKHKQSMIKVNALVDKRIAKLVEVLNSFDDVWTYSSCEGEIGLYSAHVYLFYGQTGPQNWSKTFDFASKLANVLAGSYDTCISIVWQGNKDTPHISIEIESEQIDKVAKMLADHKSVFSHGSHDRAPHNWTRCLARKN